MEKIFERGITLRKLCTADVKIVACSQRTVGNARKYCLEASDNQGDPPLSAEIRVYKRSLL